MTEIGDGRTERRGKQDLEPNRQRQTEPRGRGRNLTDKAKERR